MNDRLPNSAGLLDVRGALVVAVFVVALVALAGAVAQAGDRPAPSWTVRVLWLDLETRVGTIAPLGELEVEIMEHHEAGFPNEQAAHDRADAILEHGFRFEHDPGHGRVQHVPARLVERVEVYTVPAPAGE